MKRIRSVEPLGPMLANPILFIQGGDMPVRRRKKKPRLLDELVTPVVPGRLLDDAAEAVQQRADAYRRGPIEASPETQKALRELVNIVLDVRDRARTEPFDIPFAEWAKAKGLKLKTAYRLAEAEMIPGLVRIGRRLYVRNPNFSADALLSRVHRT
jgi:hypothetical protein